MIQVEGKIIIEDGCVRFEGPRDISTVLARVYERKLNEARNEGKHELIEGVIRGLSNIK